MRSRRARLGARMLAAASAAALVGVLPGVAQADTEYDGEATALRIEGLRLEVLPGGGDLPDQLGEVEAELDRLRAQLPKALRRDSLTLAFPDSTFGHATYGETATEVELPPNPLVGVEAVEAKSVKTPKGDLRSESSVAGLTLAGGVIRANLIRTVCTGDGDQMTVDVSQLNLKSNQDVVKSRVALQPGQAVEIAGIGTVTFNQQESDGRTFAEATNVVIDLDSDLSLEALGRIFEDTAPQTEELIKEFLTDVGRTAVGPEEETPAAEALNEENLSQLEGARLFAEADKAVDQVVAGAKENLPREAQNVLNDLVHLEGTITVANAACAQDTVQPAVQAPPPNDGPPPAEPVGNPEPPLADTGAPGGMMGMGLAGLVALAGGAFALTRLRKA